MQLNGDDGTLNIHEDIDAHYHYLFLFFDTNNFE